jgi:hypothetical protein
MLICHSENYVPVGFTLSLFQPGGKNGFGVDDESLAVKERNWPQCDFPMGSMLLRFVEPGERNAVAGRGFNRCARNG